MEKTWERGELVLSQRRLAWTVLSVAVGRFVLAALGCRDCGVAGGIRCFDRELVFVVRSCLSPHTQKSMGFSAMTSMASADSDC